MWRTIMLLLMTIFLAAPLAEAREQMFTPDPCTDSDPSTGCCPYQGFSVDLEMTSLADVQACISPIESLVERILGGLEQ